MRAIPAAHDGDLRRHEGQLRSRLQPSPAALAGDKLGGQCAAAARQTNDHWFAIRCASTGELRVALCQNTLGVEQNLRDVDARQGAEPKQGAEANIGCASYLTSIPPCAVAKAEEQ